MTNRIRKSIALGLVAIASASGGYAITEESSSGNVKVQFVEYERFTDIEVSKLTSDRQKAALLNDIAKDFQKQAGRYLPKGYSVEIKVTDVDLAGENDPKPPEGERFRLLRDTTPPRIVFDYVVRDASDQVVASDRASLMDMNYKNNAKPDFARDERLGFIDALIEDWANGDLRTALAKKS